MTFTIIDPGYDFTAVWVIGIITAVLLAWAIISAVGVSRKWWDDWVAGVSWFVTIVFFVLGFLMSALPAPGSIHDAKVDAATVEALEEIGFERVNLSGDRFVASLDGEYFEGILSETDPYTYQVNEVVAK